MLGCTEIKVTGIWTVQLQDVSILPCYFSFAYRRKLLASTWHSKFNRASILEYHPNKTRIVTTLVRRIKFLYIVNCIQKQWSQRTSVLSITACSERQDKAPIARLVLYTLLNISCSDKWVHWPQRSKWGGRSHDPMTSHLLGGPYQGQWPIEKSWRSSPFCGI